MIKQVCNSEYDVRALKVWLKQFGIGHFQGGDTTFTYAGSSSWPRTMSGKNMKRGVEIIFETSEGSINLITFLVRKAVEQWSGEMKSVYHRTIAITQCNKTWSVEFGKTRLVLDDWPAVVEKVGYYLDTLDGDPVPKKVHRDLLQNIVMSDLKDRLRKAGFGNIRFLSKAKKENTKTYLLLCVSSVYCVIHVGLKRGQLTISFEGSYGLKIGIPNFEDPKFDPEVLFNICLRAIETMQALEIESKAFNAKRTEAYDIVKNDFKNSWCP